MKNVIYLALALVCSLVLYAACSPATAAEPTKAEPVAAAAPVAPAAQVIVVNPECTEWCGHFGIIPCPEVPECDGIWDSTCLGEKCTAWNDAVTACYTKACNDCNGEHTTHENNVLALQQARDACISGCGGNSTCITNCNKTYDDGMAAETIRHTRKIAKIGSDFNDCKDAATTAYYVAIAACCLHNP